MKTIAMPKLQVSQALACVTMSTALCTWFGAERMAALPLLLIVTLAAVLSQQLLPQNAKLWARYWLVGSGMAMSALAAYLVSGSLASLGVNTLLMFAGFFGALMVGSGEWQHHLALKVYGMGLLVFALPLLLSPALSEALLLAGIYIVSSILTVSSSREEEETYLVRSRGVQMASRQSRFIVLACLVVLMILGLFLVGERVTTMLPLLGRVLSFVLERLFIVFWPLLYILEKLFSRLQLPEEQDFEMPSLPLEPGEELLQEELAPALNFPLWAGNVLLVVAVCALIYLIARSIKVSRPDITGQDEPPEERESMMDLQHALASAFRRRRATGRRKGSITDPPQSALEAYAKMVYWFARAGYQRQTHQTTREFARDACTYLPLCSPDVKEISGAMEIEFYGEEITGDEALTQLTDCVSRIAQASRGISTPQGK